MKVLAFEVTELPDAEYAKYRAKAGGDVRAAVCRDCEQLLRALASFPGGAVTAEIRFQYRPTGRSADSQSRLRLFLTVRAEDEAIADQVSSLVHHGPLSRFYDFQHVSEPPALPAKVHAACDVIRRVQLVKPLYEPEFNSNIPTCYFAIDSFEPNDKNDYLVLDQVLGNVDEAVDIVMRFEPVEVSAESFAHTKYLAELHAVNREHDHGDEPCGDIDYLGDGESWRSTLKPALRPLRYREPLADDVLRTQHRFHETLHRPNVLFQIRILSESPAVAQLIGSTVADSAFTEGSYELITYQDGEDLFARIVRPPDDLRVVILPVREALWNNRDGGKYEGLARLASMAPVAELRGVFRLPVASHSSPCCIRKKTDPKYEDPSSLLLLGYDQEPSCDGHSGCRRGLPRGVRLDRLVKHLFSAGLTGTGKSTAVQNILIQLAARGIPLMVLETAKTEYRSLKALRKHHRQDLRRLGESLEVYTIGTDTVSPFRHNPLEAHPRTGEDEKIENVLACFQAAMSLPGPAQPLIGEALERVYAEHSGRSEPPVIADLAAAADRVLAEKAYSGDTASDIRAAVEVRVANLSRRSIGKVFQCSRSVPSVEHLMQACSVIELDRLPVEQCCLLSLFILTAIREYVKISPQSDRSPRLVIVIEEAHNIVGRNTDARASEDIPDPRSHVAAYICRMLAELRALGVAMIIVDQLPSAVAPEVVKNTASKLSFREVANDDRTELGGTMLFTETEFEEIARLETGEAFFSTEGYHGPRRIQTVNLHEELNLPASIQHEELVDLLREDPWFVANAETRSAIELAQLHERMNTLDRTRLQLTKRFVTLSAELAKILSLTRPHERQVRLASLRRSVQATRQSLLAAQRSFVHGSYRALRGTQDAAGRSQTTGNMRADLVHRFENVIRPGILSCIERMDALIRRCAV